MPSFLAVCGIGCLKTELLYLQCTQTHSRRRRWNEWLWERESVYAKFPLGESLSVSFSVSPRQIIVVLKVFRLCL